MCADKQRESKRNEQQIHVIHKKIETRREKEKGVGYLLTKLLCFTTLHPRLVWSSVSVEVGYLTGG